MQQRNKIDELSTERNMHHISHVSVVIIIAHNLVFRTCVFCVGETGDSQAIGLLRPIASRIF